MHPGLMLRALALQPRLFPVTGQLNRGERLHVLGPNGAGKSTLLAAIAGLQRASGQVLLAGEPLQHSTPARLATLRGYSPQQQPPPFAQPLWHFLTLHQPRLDDSGLRATLEPLGLIDKLARPVNQLSGGEWQRARLAGVLLQMEPRYNPHGQLLLLDEPFNHLDIAQQAALDAILDRLCARGMMIMLTSHDLNHTLRHAHQVWLMAAGQRVAQGTPHDVVTPAVLQQVWPVPIRQFEAEGQRFLMAMDAGNLPASAVGAKLLSRHDR